MFKIQWKSYHLVYISICFHYSLEAEEPKAKEESSYYDTVASAVSGAYAVGSQVLTYAGLYKLDRAFAWANLPSSGSCTRVCITK